MPKLFLGVEEEVNFGKAMLTTVGEESSRNLLESIKIEKLATPSSSSPSSSKAQQQRALAVQKDDVLRRASTNSVSSSVVESVGKPRSDTLLVEEGDNLKQEIEKAVLEAEQNKLTDGGGAAYTEGEL